MFPESIKQLFTTYTMPDAAKKGAEGASKFVSQIDAAKLLDQIASANNPEFLTETAIQSEQLIHSNKPGIRHTVEKWTLPPIVGMAGAAVPAYITYKILPHVALPATKFIGGLLLHTTAALASTLYHAFPVATTVGGLAIAGTGAFAASRNLTGFNTQEAASKAFYAGVGAISAVAFGTMWMIGRFAMNTMQKSYERVEDEYATLKAHEESKMVESLKQVYTLMGDELAARFMLAKDDPVAIEKLKEQTSTLEAKLKMAAEEFAQAGLKGSDISEILQPLRRTLTIITNTKLELRSSDTQNDNKFNAYLLATLTPKSDLGLSSVAKSEVKEAHKSELPFYHKAAGYAKGLAFGALSTFSIAALSNFGLPSLLSTGAGFAVGYGVANRAISQMQTEQNASEMAVKAHTVKAREELGKIYGGVAEFLRQEKQEAMTDEKKQSLQQIASAIHAKMVSISTKIDCEKGLNSGIILRPLQDALKEILNPQPVVQVNSAPAA